MVVIHQYKNNGYNIVMDVNSGSIHVVDDIVYDMIQVVEPLVSAGIKDADTLRMAVLNLGILHYDKKALEEALDEVLELEAQGQLFAPDIYENYVYDFILPMTAIWPANIALPRKGNTMEGAR